MTTRDEMLSAIKANPAEDLPRLLYADWLDEQDDRTDHDKATAEFIRLSCRMDNKKVSSVRQGNWLDGPDKHLSAATTGVGRLIPAFRKWFDGVNAEGDSDRTGTLFYVGYPRVWLKRSGRIVTARWAKTPGFLPELIHLEFWRGFLRKAEFRHWKEAELLIPKLIGDQPLMEPEIRGAFEDDSWRLVHARRGEIRVRGGFLGHKAVDAMWALEAPYRPDWDRPNGFRGEPTPENSLGVSLIWDIPGSSLCTDPAFKRRLNEVRWAVRLALRDAYATPSQEPSGQSELASDGAFRPWPGGQVPPWPEPAR